MKISLYRFFIIMLCATAAVLAGLLFSTPMVPRDLILNEKSYLQIINEEDFRQIHSKKKQIDESITYNSKVLEAKESAGKLYDVVNQVKSLMEDATAEYNDDDSVRLKIQKLMLGLDQLKKFDTGNRIMKDYRSGVMLNNSDLIDRNKSLLGLPALIIENDLLFMGSSLFDSLLWITEAMTLNYDPMNDIKVSKGPSWVKGQIVFNAPVSMNLYQKERIQVRISKQYSEAVMATMTHEESVISDSLDVGDIMLVTLMGDDFDIKAYDDEEQGVTIEGYTQWEFDVTPKTSGSHALYVKAGIIYYVPNLGPAKKYFPVYEKAIEVEVGVMQIISGFATERWEFLVSTFLIPFAVWGFSKFRRRKK